MTDNPQPTKKDPWDDDAHSLEDAFKARPPIQEIVKGMIRRPSLTAVYGPPGCLKTMLELEKHLCIAAGIHFLESLPGQLPTGNYQTLQGPAMWIDFDMGLSELEPRIEAIARARNLDPENIPFRYYSMPIPLLDAGNPRHILALIERVKSFGAIAIGIDNLGIIKGKADENSDQMIPVMNNLRLLVETTNTAVTVIHHQNKSIGNVGREGNRLRGHSSIEAALNLALAVSRDDDSDTIKVKSTKTRGANVIPFSAMFTYEHKPGTTDLLTARFFALSDPENAKIDNAIKAALQGKEINKTTLKTEAQKMLPGVGINRISARIDHLADTEAIKRKQGARTEVFYSL